VVGGVYSVHLHFCLFLRSVFGVGFASFITSFVRWLPASLVQWWVGLGFCPFVSYPSCGGEWLPTPTESYKAEEQRPTSSFAHATHLTPHIVV